MSCGAGKGTCRGDVHGYDAGSDVNSKIIAIKIKSSKNQKRESKAANQMQMCASVQVCECASVLPKGLASLQKKLWPGCSCCWREQQQQQQRCVAAAVLICVCGFCTSRGSWQLARGNSRLATGSWQGASGKCCCQCCCHFHCRCCGLLVGQREK